MKDIPEPLWPMSGVKAQGWLIVVLMISPMEVRYL